MSGENTSLQRTIGYTFHRPELLERALCHSSYVNEHRKKGEADNERLEFLGDAVLELVSSDFIFHAYPEMPEGDMTRLRASLVCEPTLAVCARAFGLPAYIRLGKGEERTGGRNRPSIVSDALEALIGAIYLDGGLDAARSFIMAFILNDIEHLTDVLHSQHVLHGERKIKFILDLGDQGDMCERIPVFNIRSRGLFHDLQCFVIKYIPEDLVDFL